MPIRFVHLFILAALAWLAPLMAHQHVPTPEPTLVCQAVLEVAHTSGDATELPSLVEEERPEEERQAGLERISVDLSLEVDPVASSWSSAPATPFAFPVELRLASGAAPRGPPACAL